MKAEYTFAQAVALVNFASEHYHAHYHDCEDCQHAQVYEEKNLRCDAGMRLYDNRLKWRRRCKYAARREGIKITV
jgi:hypothetical protein